jgi:hypothetical protein
MTDEQKPTKEELELENQRLQIEKLKAEIEQARLANDINNRKTTADALKAEREALFPRGTTTGLAGEVKSDDKLRLPAVLLIYRAMEDCATEISNKIKEKVKGDDPKILIVDSLNVAASDYARIQITQNLDIYEKMVLQQKIALKRLLTLSEEYTRIISIITKNNPTIPLEDRFGNIGFLSEMNAMIDAAGTAALTLVPSAVLSGVSLLGDIMSYFRSDYSIKGQDVKIDDETLRLVVAGKLEEPDSKGKSISTYLPNFRMIQESGIIKALTTLIDRKQELLNLRDKVKAQYKDKETTESKAAIEACDNAIKTFDAFVTAISTPVNAETPSPLVQAVVREFVHANTKHILYVKVAASNGNVVEERRLWMAPVMLYMGGCVVSYALAKRDDGKIIMSGTVSKEKQFKKDFFDIAHAVLQNVFNE